MWTLLNTNKTHEAQDKFRDHIKHTERILQMRPKIRNDTPKKPKFLYNNLKKEQMEMEKNLKISFDNNLLLKKIIECEINPRPYHPMKIKHKICPPFDKRTSSKVKFFKQKKIDEDNEKMYKRLSSAKPTYSKQSDINSYQKHKYYENLIMKRANLKNPNLDFETPFKVKIKLQSTFPNININKLSINKT